MQTNCNMLNECKKERTNLKVLFLQQKEVIQQTEPQHL